MKKLFLLPMLLLALFAVPAYASCTGSTQVNSSPGSGNTAAVQIGGLAGCYIAIDNLTATLANLSPSARVLHTVQIWDNFTCGSGTLLWEMALSTPVTAGSYAYYNAGPLNTTFSDSAASGLCITFDSGTASVDESLSLHYYYSATQQ